MMISITYEIYKKTRTVITIIFPAVSRPHFFYGVTTVVSKLFNIVNPTHVFFGEKDAQQSRIIKKMIFGAPCG